MLYGFFYIYNCQRRDYIPSSKDVNFLAQKHLIKKDELIQFHLLYRHLLREFDSHN